ncbi:COMM domain-containing protein 8-like [Neodiprion virginianus]|uniref:COMM domain-containing protein 8-like n=1 Tax=Neodiprion virginianus TaxID=2961670 RepID=UPI001EE6C961|nr:COMM domain-containing protein 8-like [Neodiprion virginianus]
MEDETELLQNIFTQVNSDVMNQFLHACVDEICGRKRVTFQQFTNSVEWTENEYKIARQVIFDLLRNPAVLYLENERMPHRYVETPAELQLAIRTCVNIRREHLVKALLREHSIKNGTTLLDFDWRLKWIMGSSKLATLKEPLLQLDLITEDSKSQQILDLELNRDELDMLINALEEVGG